MKIDYLFDDIMPLCVVEETLSFSVFPLLFSATKKISAMIFYISRQIININKLF